MATVDIVLRGFSLTTNEGNFAPCAVYLVRGEDEHGRARAVLYDFGHVGRRQKLQASLGRLGVDPAEIDTVVLSHAHWDHVQNLDLFSAATAYVHPDELAYASHPHPHDHATPAWTSGVLESVATAPVEEGQEVMPGVRCLHLPGHTVGCVGLEVETPDGIAVLSGDAVASAADSVRERCPNAFWDGDEADRSVRRVNERADVVYPGHDRPFRRDRAGGVEHLTDIRPLVLSMRSLAGAELVVKEQSRPERTLLGRARDVAAARVPAGTGAREV